MNRLTSLWNAILFGRKEPLYSIRTLAILNCAAILGTLIVHELHIDFLSGFFAGMSAAISGILITEAFRLGSAEYKRDPHASQTIELHLSQ
jgi:hypothetical protein